MRRDEMEFSEAVIIFEFVGKAFTLDEVRTRYRQLALKHHPDKGGDAKTFAKVSAAYRVLSAALDRHSAKNAAYAAAYGGCPDFATGGPIPTGGPFEGFNFAEYEARCAGVAWAAFQEAMRRAGGRHVYAHWARQAGKTRTSERFRQEYENSRKEVWNILYGYAVEAFQVGVTIDVGEDGRIFITRIAGIRLPEPIFLGSDPNEAKKCIDEIAREKSTYRRHRERERHEDVHP